MTTRAKKEGPSMPKELVAASATPLVLSILARGDSYGYAIIQRVHELSDGQLEWTDGMLYPILHRLEEQRLVESYWQEAESGRKRKYYRIRDAGQARARRAACAVDRGERGARPRVARSREEGRMTFDEAAAIARWRASLASHGTLRKGDLDELECHLLDHVDALAGEGVDREEAFERAAAALGDASAIADEFAKVNPLLAWRTALFWIGAGVLTVLGLRPVQVLAAHAIVSGTLALHLPRAAITVLVWSVAFLSPLVFFAGSFALVPLRTRVVSLFARPSARVIAIVGAAVTMLVEHLGASWGWFFAWEERAFEHASLDHAWNVFWMATTVLGVADGARIPQERSARRRRAGDASSFWLAVGFFVGTIRCEMHELVRYLTLASAALGHLGPAQTGALVWTVTLASPCLLAAATYTFLRHHSPLPSGVARGHGIVVSLVVATVMAIAAVFLTRPVGHHANSILAFDAYVAGIHAWLVSSIVMSALLPILVGVLTFRLRDRTVT
jgi:PadR family transcriptional regulator, regulatory protein PadR